MTTHTDYLTKEKRKRKKNIILFPAGDMLDLLKWRAHPERISDSLSKLKEIDGSEIVKVSCTSEPCCWLMNMSIMVAFALIVTLY